MKSIRMLASPHASARPTRSTAVRAREVDVERRNVASWLPASHAAILSRSTPVAAATTAQIAVASGQEPATLLPRAEAKLSSAVKSTTGMKRTCLTKQPLPVPRGSLFGDGAESLFYGAVPFDEICNRRIDCDAPTMKNERAIGGVHISRDVRRHEDSGAVRGHVTQCADE